MQQSYAPGKIDALMLCVDRQNLHSPSLISGIRDFPLFCFTQNLCEEVDDEKKNATRWELFNILASWVKLEAFCAHYAHLSLTYLIGNMFFFCSLRKIHRV